jgi:hypothetical protein
VRAMCTREPLLSAALAQVLSLELTEVAFALRSEVSYTMFEGTSEIQRLVVARSISGLHIP